MYKKLSLAVFTVTTSILGLLSQSPAQALNLISNGGFETGDFTDWTPSGTVGVISVPVSEGSFSAVFGFGNTPNDGVLFQDIETVIGQSYNLSFDFGLNKDPFIDQFLQVELIGSSVLLNETLSAQGPIDFNRFTFDFVADSTTTQVRFSDQSSETFRIDIHLDDVVVEAVVAETVPEPTSVMSLAFIGTLGLGAIAGCKHQ